MPSTMIIYLGNLISQGNYQNRDANICGKSDADYDSLHIIYSLLMLPCKSARLAQAQSHTLDCCSEINSPRRITSSARSYCPACVKPVYAPVVLTMEERLMSDVADEVLLWWPRLGSLSVACEADGCTGSALLTAGIDSDNNGAGADISIP